MISTEWLTPPEFVEYLRPWSPFGLDPCAHPRQFIQAKNHVYRPRNLLRGGLVVDWKRLVRGRAVWVNPPWNNRNDILPHWSEKILLESDRGVEVLAILPGYTDTNWYQVLYPRAASVIALKGRVSYRRARDLKKGPARFASHVFYFGRRPGAFRRAFLGAGLVLKAGRR